MTVPDKKATLTGVARARARLEAVELKVLAASDDIAEATGDRSTATWLANQTREAHGTVRRKAVLARALASRWAQTADALEAGEVNLAQARVIAEALEALPNDLSGDLLLKAEALLVEEAAKLGPQELAVLGARVLERLAPEIAEEAEYQRLLAAERRAARGHPAAPAPPRRRVHRPPRPHPRPRRRPAARLPQRLHRPPPPTPAGPADRRDAVRAADTGRPRTSSPTCRWPGSAAIAFVALLENVLSSDLPRHGGNATSVIGPHPLRQPPPRPRRGRDRHHLHRRPHHRRPGPPTGLPGPDPARRPGRRSPRSSTSAASRGCSNPASARR